MNHYDEIKVVIFSKDMRIGSVIKQILLINSGIILLSNERECVIDNLKENPNCKLLVIDFHIDLIDFIEEIRIKEGIRNSIVYICTQNKFNDTNSILFKNSPPETLSKILYPIKLHEFIDSIYSLEPIAPGTLDVIVNFYKTKFNAISKQIDAIKDSVTERNVDNIKNSLEEFEKNLSNVQMHQIFNSKSLKIWISEFKSLLSSPDWEKIDEFNDDFQSIKKEFWKTKFSYKNGGCNGSK